MIWMHLPLVVKMSKFLLNPCRVQYQRCSFVYWCNQWLFKLDPIRGILLLVFLKLTAMVLHVPEK